MSDKGQPPILVALRLRRQIAQMHLNVANEKYVALEARERMAKSRENVGAAAAEIDKLEQSLAEHMDAHGLTEAELEEEP